MDDHDSDHSGHEGGANEEGISVLEGCSGCEFKDEVVIDSFTLPHEQIASIHEQMQTQQSNYAAKQLTYTSIYIICYFHLIFCQRMNKIDLQLIIIMALKMNGENG